MINLKVKTLDAQTHEFTVDNEITVREFKDKILEKTNIPVAQQRIIYRGRVLGDDSQLKDLDVEGKVLHVAEQPPPQLREPSPSAASSGSEAQAEVRDVLEARGRRYPPLFRALDGLVVGTMAMPMHGGVINPFAPSSSFCMNRITVARHMLDCANNIAAYLEDPSRGLENVPLDILSRGRWTMESTVVEVGITNADLQQNNNILQMVQNAVQSALRRAGHTTNNVAVMQLPTVITDLAGARSAAQSQADEHIFTGAASASVALNDAAASPLTPRININDVSNSSSDTDATFLHPASVTYDNNEEVATGAAASPANNGTRRTNTQVLADVIDQMHQVQARLEPFTIQYYEILRNEPAFEDADSQQNAQRIFDRVSEAMHYMAHAQHAISDLMLDVTLPTPRFLTCRPILVEQSGYVSANNLIPTLAHNLTGNGPRQSTAQQTLARGALLDAMRAPIVSHFGPAQIRNAYRSPTHFQRRRHSASSSGNNRRSGSIAQAIDSIFNNFGHINPNAVRGTNQVAQPQQSQTAPNNFNVVNRGNRTIITSTVDPNVFEYINQNMPSTTSPSANEDQANLAPATSSTSTSAMDNIGNFINAINNSAQANNVMPEVEVLPPIIVAVHDDGTHDTLNMSSNENNADMQQIWGPVNIAPPDGDLRVHIEPPRVIPMFTTSNAATSSTNSSATSAQPNTNANVTTNNVATQSPRENSSNRDNANNTDDTSANARRDVRFVTHAPNNRNQRSIPAVNANMIAFDRFLPCNSHHIDYIHANQQTAAQAGTRIFTTPSGGMRTAATNTNARNPLTNMPRITTVSNYIPLLSEMRANNNTARRSNQMQDNESETTDSAETSGSSAENMGEESHIEDGSHSLEVPQTSQSHDGNTIEMPLDVRVGNLREQLQNFLRIHFFSFRGVNASSKSLALEKATEEFTRYLIFLPQYELPEYDSRASVIKMFRAMFPELLELCFLEQAMPDFEVALRSLTQKFCQRLYSVISVCVGGTNVELPWRQLMRGLQHQIYLGLGLEAVDFMCSYINSWLDWSVDATDIEEFLVKKEQKASEIMEETANVNSTEEQPAKNSAGAPEPQPMETDEQETEKASEDLDWRSLGIDFEENASNNGAAIEQDYVPEPAPVRNGSAEWHRNVPNSWVPYLARDEKLQEDMAKQNAEDRQQQSSSSRRHIHQEPYSDAYIAGMLSKRRKLLHMTKPPTDVVGLLTDCSRKAVVSLDVNNTTMARDIQCADNIALQMSQDTAVTATLTRTIRATLRERLNGTDAFDELRFPNTAKFLHETNQSHKSDTAVNGNTNAADTFPSTSSAVTATNVIPALPAKKQDTVTEKTEHADLSVDSQQKKTN